MQSRPYYRQVRIHSSFYVDPLSQCQSQFPMYFRRLEPWGQTDFMYVALRARIHICCMHPILVVYPEVMIIYWVNPVP